MLTIAALCGLVACERPGRGPDTKPALFALAPPFTKGRVDESRIPRCENAPEDGIRHVALMDWLWDQTRQSGLLE